jgi:hypothetical protein
MVPLRNTGSKNYPDVHALSSNIIFSGPLYIPLAELPVDYDYLRVLTERNRNRNDASGGSYRYGTVHFWTLRPYTVVKNEINLK